MGQRTLNYYANQIELTLTGAATRQTITGGSIHPDAVRFRVAQHINRNRVQALRQQLAHTLGSDVKIITDHGELHLETARAVVERISLPRLVAGVGEAPLPRLAALLGVAGDDVSPLLLDLSQPGAWHLLIWAAAGQGTGSLLHSLALSLAMLNRQSEAQLLPLGPLGRRITAAWPHRLSRSLRRADIEAARQGRRGPFTPVEVNLHHLLTDVIPYRRAAGITRPHLLVLADDLPRPEALHPLLSAADVGLHVIAAAAPAGPPPAGFPALITRQPSDEPGLFMLSAGRLTQPLQAAAATADETARVLSLLRRRRPSRRWSIDELTPPTRRRWWRKK